MTENRRRGPDRRGESRNASPGRRAADRGKGPAGGNALARVLVWDRVVVGPPRLEKRRVITPYTVERGKESETLDLIYRYEEDVFDPADPESANLAAMVTAQLALNYGLFAREIVFHGPFDRADRRFLADMAQNTAREIYVKKLLEPNPLLVEGASGFRAEERESYLQAALTFPEASDGAAKAPRPRPWSADPNRYAVLSSGGKDSLLSYGLLGELGKDAHAVFVNESGKHWFTALNAHRSLAAATPRTTSRVWTNSDRLFAWMARRLPFVRPDFQKVRADEYPVRLWTVAVFLFGALPVMRKRGLGRLVIGDEYDTTRRMTRDGVPHYDGLYDQSVYFDTALSRYFGRKGWRVAQFSILRHLSELLIQKILTERYPELQKDQVSCHAAHMEGERVRPCGSCEKCRRIVSMLAVLGADPARCGYGPEQVKSSLASIAAKGVAQDAEDAQELAFLLKEKGLVGTTGAAFTAKEHPEVLMLRFDRDRAPANAMPVELREPLYRIYLEHARGAARKSGRMWIEFDPLNDPDRERPYPFAAPALPGGGAGAGAGDRDFVLGMMNWPQAEARLKQVDVALLPVGSIEQHGPHLPLDTDAFDADYLAREVARGCSEPRPLVLPLIPYGVSYHHDDFKGTLSISPEALSRLVFEVGMSAARNGVTKLVIVNGHGGNSPALQFAAQMINRDAQIFTCVDTGESSDSEINALTETPNDVHAGEIETSTTLAVRPDLVDLAKAKRMVPRFSNRYLEFTSSHSVSWYARTSRLSASGIMGDPTKASREKGERMWAIMVKNLVELVEDIKGMSLDEIHYTRR